MLRGFATLAAGIAALLGAAGAADAADVKYPDGRSEKIAPYTEVTGPAVVTSDSGKGTIRLRSGAVLRCLPKSAEDERTLPTGVVESRTIEMMFLKHGIADADLDFDTRLATPAFWLLAKDRGERVRATVCSIDRTSSHARVDENSGMARLYVRAVERVPLEAQLLAGQGARLSRDPDGGIRFRTDAHNEWKHGLARLIYPLGDGTHLDLDIPKGTSGWVEPAPGKPEQTEVGSGRDSWVSGSIRVVRVRATGEADSEMTIDAGSARDIARSHHSQVVCSLSLYPERVLARAREESNRGLRHGSTHFGDRVEVVGFQADLLSEKRFLRFVLENVDRTRPAEAIGELRFIVRFPGNGGETDLGSWFQDPRPLPTQLGALGERVTVTVEDVPTSVDLAGAWPTLELLR